MELSDFSRVLIHLRKEKGVSQRVAAENLGISQSLLSHYEKGIRECGLLFLVRAADYYGVTVDYILGRSYEKNGTTISVDELADENVSGKGNVGVKSMLPTLNKKLICNSVAVLTDTLAKINNKQLTTEVSNYLDIAVYKMFRMLYDSNDENSKEFFGADDKMYSFMADSAMNTAQMNIVKALENLKKNGFDFSTLDLNQENIKEAYPVLSTSLFNLLQTAENKIGARKK